MDERALEGMRRRTGTACSYAVDRQVAANRLSSNVARTIRTGR